MANEHTATLLDLPSGSMFGPYRIRRLLGRGGMGVVYEAEHAADGRVVALKLLTVDLDKMDARERFLREGQTAAAINHPNAVYIYGTEEIEGTPAITMELVPGGTLDEKIKERGGLPWTEAVEDILQVVDGLNAAYSAGILHRDVKPSNCFVGPAGTVKIGDFGLSKPIDAGEQQKLTQTGLFLGTPVYSSPEQLLGEALDVRSDIYAVGVTFYSLLTGQLPYHSGSMMQVLAAVLNGVPTPITNFRRDLPQPVIDVVMKAMARKAGDRYQSYAELHDAVAALRVDELVPATLWDRFRATIVDWGVNVVVVLIVSFAFFPGAFSAGNGRASDWRQIVASLVATLIIVGIPEALYGKSIGKWMVGIRVTGPDGSAPGFVREAGRILILAGSDFATLTIQHIATTAGIRNNASFLALFFWRGALLLTVRRSNGWRMLHDILTGTRVSRTRATAEQRAARAHRATAPVLTGTERHVGPYVVVGSQATNESAHHVASTDTVLNGWDVAMRRGVSIVLRSDDVPPASAARRTLSRLTRLRWIGGRRAPHDSWDAFEAPVGEPFAERLTRPISWAVQQHWLLDISNELIAAEADGTLPGHPDVDALWVTPADRIVFTEGVTAEGVTAESVTADATQSLADTSHLSLAAQLLDRVQSARTSDAPLPGYAVRAHAAIRTAATPQTVRSIVQATLGRPIAVSRARRVGMMAATLAPIVLLTLIGAFSAAQGARADRAGYTMSSLVSFVADSAKTNPDSVRRRAAEAEANPRMSSHIARAMESIGLLTAATVDTVTPPATLRRQRHLAEVYLSSVLSARARDTVTPSSFGRTEREVRSRLAILARNPVIDSGEAREARLLVDSVWQGVAPGNEISTVSKFIPFVLSGSAIVFGAVVSVLAGLLVRRGPLLRGFQLDLVTRAGTPAGRMRLLVRNLAVWSVLLMPLPAMLLATRLSIAALGTVLVGSAALYATLWVAGVWLSLQTPSRGLAERVSGTWLVPE